MTPEFDWHLIRSFLAALDAGSLLGAAKVLGTSQPMVGRACGGVGIATRRGAV